MTTFKALRDFSNYFHEELQRSSAELFASKVGQNYEDCVAKKLRDLTLFSSKLRLLQAKPIAITPQEVTTTDSNDVIKDYSKLAVEKVIEQQIVKSGSNSNHVKLLLTTPDSCLDPELIERKEKIADQISKYEQKEYELRQLTALLRDREEELRCLREEWDVELKSMRDTSCEEAQVVEPGPLHSKLQNLTRKMEVMRWLISKLVTSQVAGYDWVSDTKSNMHALILARQHCTVDRFTQ